MGLENTFAQHCYFIFVATSATASIELTESSEPIALPARVFVSPQSSIFAYIIKARQILEPESLKNGDQRTLAT